MKLTDVDFTPMGMPQALREQLEREKGSLRAGRKATPRQYQGYVLPLKSNPTGEHPLATAVAKAKGQPYSDQPPPRTAKEKAAIGSLKTQRRKTDLMEYFQARNFPNSMIATMSPTFMVRSSHEKDLKAIFKNEPRSTNVVERWASEGRSMQNRWDRFQEYKATYGKQWPDKVYQEAVDRDIEYAAQAQRRGLTTRYTDRPYEGEFSGVFKSIEDQEKRQRQQDVNMALTQMRVTSNIAAKEALRKKPGNGMGY
jgi:hypothetical protein